MKRDAKSISQRFVGDQSGQMLVWGAFLMVVFFGMSAFVIDVGRGLVAYRHLQSSTNAAALAAGYSLPNANYNCVALEYSSSLNTNSASTNTNYCGSGASSVYTGANQYPELQNVTTTVTPLCSKTVAGTGWNIPCQGIGTGSTTANVVRVTQTASIPTFFTEYMGVSKLNISTTAFGAARGAGAESWNVAIILDATASMVSNQDSNCGTVPGVSGTPTREQCALYGIQILLGNLNPCPTSFSSCSTATTTSERVSLWAFPNVVASQRYLQTNCSGSIPTPEPYTFPSATPSKTNFSTGTVNSQTVTYAVTNTDNTGATPSFLTNYRSSDTSATISNSSPIVDAVGGGSGSSCSHTLQTNGGAGTYYAPILYAAQAQLLAEQAAILPQTSQNAIIILSDGDAESSQSQMASTATKSGSYPSWIDECGQAATAAQTIAGQGTRIYSIAYGSESSGCNTDGGTPTPCNSMRHLSSSYWATPSTDQYFYADSNQSGSGIDTSCNSNVNNTVTNLKSIFLAISNDLQNSRLIPYSVASN